MPNERFISNQNVNHLGLLNWENITQSNVRGEN